MFKLPDLWVVQTTSHLEQDVFQVLPHSDRPDIGAQKGQIYIPQIVEIAVNKLNWDTIFS